MTVIVYGSTMGNTENAATQIAQKIGDSKLVNVSDLSEDIFDDSDTVLLGSSTWGSGDLQDDWEGKIDLLKSINLSEKRVGFFGTGDQESYSDTFVDAIGILYEAVKNNAGEIIGRWPTDGYNFSDSAAVIDGFFIGLALDEDNQSEMTESRISSWISAIA